MAMTTEAPYQMTVTAQSGKVKISCVIQLEVSSVSAIVDGTGIVTGYKLTGLNGLEYTSYEVDHVQEDTNVQTEEVTENETEA